MRGMLAQSVSAAAHHIASKGLAAEGSPALVKMISTIAQRFSVQVSEKLAAEALPIVGAAGGALINPIFIHHF
jgi:deoxyxylulose-5-phosphate synthase